MDAEQFVVWADTGYGIGYGTWFGNGYCTAGTSDGDGFGVPSMCDRLAGGGYGADVNGRGQPCLGNGNTEGFGAWW